MRLLLSVSVLFFSQLSFATPGGKSTNLNDAIISNVVDDSAFNADMFHSCSIRVDEKYLPINGFEKLTFSSDSILLKSNNKEVHFNISANNKIQLLAKLSKQKENCAKRVREYRRHPAY